jgi:glycosyltransferase involved in cell wall biosynthesis
MPHVSRRMRFYARWCDDLVFTATESSLLLDLPNKRVVGHGIDTELFTPTSQSPDRDFVTIGRISPIKHIDEMIRAIAVHREQFGSAPSLDIVGQIGENRPYVDQLETLVAQLALDSEVRFLGHVEYHELPKLLPRYRASLNFSGTALDKSVGESMACGVPVLTTNPCVKEILTGQLRSELAVTHDASAQALAMHRALSWDPGRRLAIGERLRATILAEHGLTSLFDRIIAEVEATRRNGPLLGAARDGSA